MVLADNFYSGNQTGAQISMATLKAGTPIKDVIRELGAVKTIFLLNELIRNYCSQFNVSKNMTDAQMESLAADLYLGFKERPGNSVMLEELAVFFDRAAKGEFFNKAGKKLIPFDRIDRSLIEEMMDVYFETDRTEAVWAIEDIKEQNRRNLLNDETVAENYRLSHEAGSASPETIGDIYTDMAGKPGQIGLAKLIQEAQKKYGNE